MGGQGAAGDDAPYRGPSSRSRATPAASRPPRSRRPRRPHHRRPGCRPRTGGGAGTSARPSATVRLRAEARSRWCELPRRLLLPRPWHRRPAKPARADQRRAEHSVSSSDQVGSDNFDGQGRGERGTHRRLLHALRLLEVGRRQGRLSRRRLLAKAAKAHHRCHVGVHPGAVGAAWSGREGKGGGRPGGRWRAPGELLRRRRDVRAVGLAGVVADRDASPRPHSQAGPGQGAKGSTAARVLKLAVWGWAASTLTPLADGDQSRALGRRAGSQGYATSTRARAGLLQRGVRVACG